MLYSTLVKQKGQIKRIFAVWSFYHKHDKDDNYKLFAMVMFHSFKILKSFIVHLSCKILYHKLSAPSSFSKMNNLPPGNLVHSVNYTGSAIPLHCLIHAAWWCMYLSFLHITQLLTNKKIFFIKVMGPILAQKKAKMQC